MTEGVTPHGHGDQPTDRPHTQRVRPTSTFANHSSNQASVEIATRAADHFTRIYYTTYDSETRLDDLPQFYRPSSSLTWNGKAIQGADGLRRLIEKIPPPSMKYKPLIAIPLQAPLLLREPRIASGHIIPVIAHNGVWKCYSWTWTCK